MLGLYRAAPFLRLSTSRLREELFTDDPFSAAFALMEVRGNTATYSDA
jgi:hypothetical protein